MNRRQRRAQEKAQRREQQEKRARTREKISDAVGSVEAELEAEEAGEDIINEWTMSNGVRLKLKRIPPQITHRVAQEYERPMPPEVIVDEETGRTDTNPDDPEYLAALQEYAETVNEAVFMAAVAFGAEVAEIPEDCEVHPPESDEWINELESVYEIQGIDETVPREPPRRRFAYWLRWYAIQDDADYFAVARILTARTALTEREVAQAVARFRRLAVGFPDLVGTISEWTGIDGDSIQELLEGDSLGV